jgi:hypothetical protein
MRCSKLSECNLRVGAVFGLYNPKDSSTADLHLPYSSSALFFRVVLLWIPYLGRLLLRLGARWEVGVTDLLFTSFSHADVTLRARAIVAPLVLCSLYLQYH